jgi:hypothetical protein
MHVQHFGTSRLSARFKDGMARLRWQLVTLLAALGALPALAAAQQNQPGNLTLSASADNVRFGQSVTLSGKLTGPNNDGRNVTLREDPFPFDAFDNVGNATTGPTGDYAFTRTPTVNTRYQARQGSEESQVVEVTVSPRVSMRVGDRTPAAGRRVRFRGRVCPEHDGATLAIQRRRAPGQWRTVRRTTLADVPGTTCSRYSRRVRVRRDGRYRAFLAADADHAAGASRSRRIDVH